MSVTHTMRKPNSRPLGWMPVFVLLAVAGCSDSGNGSTSTSAVSSGAPASQPAKAPDGEQIYNRYCFSCHAAGLAGAPKTGVAEDWQPRAAKGSAALLASTIAGIPPGMPAMGLCGNCSEAELQAAISHMLVKSEVQPAP